MSSSGRYARPRRGVERIFPALGRRLRTQRAGHPLAPFVAVAVIVVGIGVSALALAPSSPLSITASPERRDPPGAAPTTDPPPSTTTDPGSDSLVLGAEVSVEPADLMVQVVPAVRDVQVDIDGRRYSSDAEGRIQATVQGSNVQVDVVGYQVTPAVQQVAFTQWGDGSTAPERTLSSDGSDMALDLGVEVSYQVVVEAEGAPEDTVAAFATSAGGSDLEVEVGEPTWIPAVVASPAGDDNLAADTLTYEVSLDDSPVGSGPYTPTPEGLLQLG